MASKTPFEIRLEVLQMAKEYMDRQAAINVEFATETFMALVEAGEAAGEQWEQYIPQAYSAAELMNKANEFYSFIIKK
jgi:hypothetical protein